MGYKRVVITEFGEPEVLKMIEETKLPEPKSGEVRVKVLATSAAFTDVWIRKGTYPDVKEKPPFSPGSVHHRFNFGRVNERDHPIDGFNCACQEPGQTL